MMLIGNGGDLVEQKGRLSVSFVRPIGYELDAFFSNILDVEGLFNKKQYLASDFFLNSLVS